MQVEAVIEEVSAVIQKLGAGNMQEAVQEETPCCLLMCMYGWV